MAFALEDYERVVGRVEIDDIDFAAFEDQPLSEDVLRCLRYMHDVEQHTSCYLRNLLNTRAHEDPEISAFLTMWSFEEHWHGDAIGRVLTAHGEPAGHDRIAAMRGRLGRGQQLSPIGWMALSAATRHFLAVHMTFGVVNEWTTQAGYARLRAVARHPVLDDLLARIMKQEGRHIDFYVSQARARLAPAGAQRTTRLLLRTAWSPVGSKVMPVEETRHLARTLFGGEAGRPFVERIDRRIDSLPGLAGLRLMARSQARLGPAGA